MIFIDSIPDNAEFPDVVHEIIGGSIKCPPCNKINEIEIKSYHLVDGENITFMGSVVRHASTWEYSEHWTTSVANVMWFSGRTTIDDRNETHPYLDYEEIVYFATEAKALNALHYGMQKYLESRK